MKKIALIFSCMACLAFGQYSAAADANVQAPQMQPQVQTQFDGNTQWHQGQGQYNDNNYQGGVQQGQGADGVIYGDSRPQNWERPMGNGCTCCCTYCPRYYTTCQCHYEPQYSYQRCCRMVPEHYQRTCCRYVPQYYQVDCCRDVPQYYYTCQCKQCPKYCYQKHCCWVPQYSYKQECCQPCEPCAPACCP